MPIVDFDKAGEGYTVLPAGTYKVRIKKAEFKTSTTGNPMIQWHAVVIEGVLIGSTVSDFTSLTDAAVWKAANLIKAAGVEVSGKLDTNSKKFERLVQACVGQGMYWKVQEDVNAKGNPTNKVEAYARDTEQASVSCVEDIDAPDFARG
jgi:hypothetical protein